MRLIVLGAIMALGVPGASVIVAAFWSGGVIDPHPDGAVVQTLQSVAIPGLVLSPIGLLLVAWGAGVRSRLAWAAVLLWGLPVLAVMWFVSIAWLGGLAGEPF
jgi:hypothetical protein